MPARKRTARTAATPTTPDATTTPDTTTTDGDDMTTDTTTTPDDTTTTATTDADVTTAADAAMTGDTTAYVAADRSGRARIRAALDARMRAALSDGDMATAVAANAALDACRTAAGTATAATPAVDWDAVTAERIATLYAAADALLSGAMTIDGTPDDYRPTFTTDPFTTTTDADAVRAYATKRVTRRAPTNDVAAAIVSALTDAGVDDDGAPVRLSVAAIRRHWVANGGPANADGRIAARLWPANGDDTTVPNVRTYAATGDGPRTASLLSVTPTDD